MSEHILHLQITVESWFLGSFSFTIFKVKPLPLSGQIKLMTDM